jgi:hypothetical protein
MQATTADGKALPPELMAIKSLKELSDALDGSKATSSFRTGRKFTVHIQGGFDIQCSMSQIAQCYLNLLKTDETIGELDGSGYKLASELRGRLSTLDKEGVLDFEKNTFSPSRLALKIAKKWGSENRISINNLNSQRVFKDAIKDNIRGRQDLTPNEKDNLLKLIKSKSGCDVAKKEADKSLEKISVEFKAQAEQFAGLTSNQVTVRLTNLKSTIEENLFNKLNTELTEVKHEPKYATHMQRIKDKFKELHGNIDSRQAAIKSLQDNILKEFESKRNSKVAPDWLKIDGWNKERKELKDELTTIQEKLVRLKNGTDKYLLDTKTLLSGQLQDIADQKKDKLAEVIKEPQKDFVDRQQEKMPKILERVADKTGKDPINVKAGFEGIESSVGKYIRKKCDAREFELTQAILKDESELSDFSDTASFRLTYTRTVVDRFDNEDYIVAKNKAMQRRDSRENLNLMGMGVPEQLEVHEEPKIQLEKSVEVDGKPAVPGKQTLGHTDSAVHVSEKVREMGYGQKSVGDLDYVAEDVLFLSPEEGELLNPPQPKLPESENEPQITLGPFTQKKESKGEVHKETQEVKEVITEKDIYTVEKGISELKGSIEEINKTIAKIEGNLNSEKNKNKKKSLEKILQKTMEEKTYLDNQLDVKQELKQELKLALLKKKPVDEKGQEKQENLGNLGSTRQQPPIIGLTRDYVGSALAPEQESPTAVPPTLKKEESPSKVGTSGRAHEEERQTEEIAKQETAGPVKEQKESLEEKINNLTKEIEKGAERWKELSKKKIKVQKEINDLETKGTRRSELATQLQELDFQFSEIGKELDMKQSDLTKARLEKNAGATPKEPIVENLREAAVPSDEPASTSETEKVTKLKKSIGELEGEGQTQMEEAIVEFSEGHEVSAPPSEQKNLSKLEKEAQSQSKVTAGKSDGLPAKKHKKEKEEESSWFTNTLASMFGSGPDDLEARKKKMEKEQLKAVKDKETGGLHGEEEPKKVDSTNKGKGKLVVSEKGNTSPLEKVEGNLSRDPLKNMPGAGLAPDPNTEKKERLTREIDDLNLQIGQIEQHIAGKFANQKLVASMTNEKNNLTNELEGKLKERSSL